MIEQWKNIPDYYPYEVSNYGRLRRNGVVLTTPIGKVGYHRKYLKDLKKNLMMHRAIAICFIANPNGYTQVNHKDGNKANNEISNLEWVTPSQNIQHAVDNNLKSIVMGQDHGRSKLTNLQVSVIRESLTLGHKQSKIAKYFNLHQSTISLIKSRKNWASC